MELDPALAFIPLPNECRTGTNFYSLAALQEQAVYRQILLIHNNRIKSTIHLTKHIHITYQEYNNRFESHAERINQIAKHKS